MSERVWCVPASAVHERRPRAGFWRGDGELAAWLAAEGAFRARAEVETDETLRQVIPYLVLRSAGRYFVYRRLAGSGEARLVHLHSIGVGGHINDEHLAADLEAVAPVLRPNLLADGLGRELSEELVVPAGAVRGLSLHGYLALDATPVDRVHVGVVAVAEIAPETVDRVDVRETDKLAAVGWRTAGELIADLELLAFEGWSRAVIEAGLD